MNNISQAILFVVFIVACSQICGSHGKRFKHSKEVLKTGRIVGGSTAEDGFAPYQVSLQTIWGHFCGGAIIDKRWVITAAHCVYYRDPETVLILTGTQDLNKEGTFYRVDRISVHCNYENPPMANDIALLHLNSTIVENEFTRAIDLPTKPLKDGAAVVLTGWGSEEAWGESPSRLKKVNLEYMPYEKCRGALDNDPDLDVGHMCTFIGYGEGACHGDSGGPLVNNNTLVGIVNWGYPCAIGYPDANASPYFYLDWIRRTMGGKNKCLNMKTIE